MISHPSLESLLEEFDRMVQFAVDDDIIVKKRTHLILSWRNFIYKSYEAGQKEMIEKVREIVPKEKISDMRPYGYPEIEIDIGFNSCRSQLLQSLSDIEKEI